MKERQVAAGDVIYREGDPGDAVFVVQEGEVEILRETDGKTFDRCGQRQPGQ